MSDTLQQLWDAHAASPGSDARQQLILYYAPLVRAVAGRVAGGLPAHVDLDDLQSHGMLGLIDAVDRYDPARGVPFEGYATRRVHGAILDELRSADWVPRSVRQRARQVEDAIRELEAVLHRAPTDDEVARAAGITLRQLWDVYQKMSYSLTVSLDEALRGSTDAGAGAGAGAGTLADTVADRGAADPVARYEELEDRYELARAISELPEREMVTLTLYYYENMTLAEIGQVLGVGESRVSQLRAKGVMLLRHRLMTAQPGNNYTST